MNVGPLLVSQTVSIGKDAYGRPVTMTRRSNYDGKVLWEIKSAAAEQRDQGYRIDGLTDDNVRNMVLALDAMSPRK
jgi:hypothetical protein